MGVVVFLCLLFLALWLPEWQQDVIAYTLQGLTVVTLISISFVPAGIAHFRLRGLRRVLIGSRRNAPAILTRLERFVMPGFVNEIVAMDKEKREKYLQMTIDRVRTYYPGFDDIEKLVRESR